jgi:hypothetical protein
MRRKIQYLGTTPMSSVLDRYVIDWYRTRRQGNPRELTGNKGKQGIRRN